MSSSASFHCHGNVKEVVHHVGVQTPTGSLVVGLRVRSLRGLASENLEAYFYSEPKDAQAFADALFDAASQAQRIADEYAKATGTDVAGAETAPHEATSYAQEVA